MQSELELNVDADIIESMTDNETTRLDNQIISIHPDSNLIVYYSLASALVFGVCMKNIVSNSEI